MARSNEPAGAPGVIWIVLDDRMVQKCELVCFSPKVSDMSGGVLRRKLRQPVARIFFQHPSLRGERKSLMMLLTLASLYGGREQKKAICELCLKDRQKKPFANGTVNLSCLQTCPNLERT
ncbi:hypothetical protein V2G26_003606 [Clonostachys chloroleuca]